MVSLRRLAAVSALLVLSLLPSHAMHEPTFDPDSGPALRWEGAFGDVASYTGNKNTAIELFSWTDPGGMRQSFTLYHNNRSTHNSELGHKWTHSYDIYLQETYAGESFGPSESMQMGPADPPAFPFLIDHATVHWGTDGACQFNMLAQASDHIYFTSPPGIYDELFAYVNEYGQPRYKVTTKEGIRYEFRPNLIGPEWVCHKIIDRFGNETTIDWSAELNVQSVFSGGRGIFLNYPDNVRISSIIGPGNKTWNLFYNAAGDLIRIDWPPLNGQTYFMEFSYTPDHNLSGIRDKRGNWWTYGYNGDLIAWAKDPMLNQWTFSGSSMVDPNNRPWQHIYDANGTLQTERDPLNLSTVYVRDANHNPTQITDRRGKVWQRTYDSKGNCTSELTPLTHLWEWWWTTNSELAAARTPLTHLTVYDRDPNTGALLSITDPLNHTWVLGWNAQGDLTQIANPLNFPLFINRDGYGNAISVTDANNSTQQATHDVYGRILTYKDGLLNEQVYTRDDWGRVTAVSIGGVTVWTGGYDLNDNLIWERDGLNNQTTRVFDAADRLVSETNGRGDIEIQTWDAPGKKGLLSSKTNGNNQTTVYNYTARNEKASNVYADGTSESWTYGPEGEMLSHRDGKNQLIQYLYDDSLRLIKIDYPTGIDTDITHDPSDRRTQMVDSSGTTGWTWDAADRLTQITSPNGTVGYGYDNANRRTSMTVTGQGTWAFGYDPGDRLTSILNPYSETTAWVYNAADLPIQQTFSSGAFTTWQYDAMLRPTDVWHKTSAGATLGRYQYGYNAVNPISRSDNDGSVTGFLYDGANQLTGETRTGPNPYTLGYLYDNNGNRIRKTLNGMSEDYVYGPNDRIQSAGARTYATDNNGNITGVTVNGQTTGLTYDFENRLTRIDFPGGTFDTFKYNGLGLRVQKVDSAGIQNYLTDGAEPASPVIADSTATYTPGISERRGGISKFYHGDHLGSTRGITNSAQTPTDSMLHDAFGALVSRTGTTPTPFGYVGQEQYQTDSDSGLMLLGHRYYDPYTGRFITPDPIGDDRNWYGYVGNDPLSWIDPWGLQRAQMTAAERATWLQDRIDVMQRELAPVFEAEDRRRQRIQEISDDLEQTMKLKAPDNWIIMALGMLRPSPSRGLGGNPFKGRTAQQIHDRLIEKGYSPRGQNPIAGIGGYVNPRTGRSIHIDPANSHGEPPHVDINRLRRYKGKLEKKKFPFKGT